jgi:hypothetical protein
MSECIFNNNEAPPPEDFAPLPAGTEAISEIFESEYKKANEKGTRMLNLKYRVLDGQFKGRVISNGYCLECPSSQVAQDIAQRKLRQICEALNMTGFTMTEELHGKPLLVKYGQDAPNDNGDVYNNVKSVKSCTGSVQAPVATQQASTAQAVDTNTAAPSDNKPPWAK